MITAYYSKNKKYLKKGDYKKEFDDVQSLQELIKKVKTKEKISIYAGSKDIIDFKLYSNVTGSFEFHVLKQIIPLTQDILQQDIQELQTGQKKYVRYVPKNQTLWGKEVYIVSDLREYKKIKQTTQHVVIPLKDINNALEKPQEYIIKHIFNAKNVLDNIHQKDYNITKPLNTKKNA